MANHVVIKTLTDYHIEDFLRCPQSFYRRHFCQSPTDTWQNRVQRAIYQIVKEFFKIPPSSRNVTYALRLIDRYWEKDITPFDTREHYFHILGSITQHLIDFLVQERENLCPLFVMEKINLFIPQWNASIAMTLPFVNWGTKTFVVKKLILDENNECLMPWIYFTLFLCGRAFQKTPEKLEFYNLLSGRSFTFTPSDSMITEAEDYISLFKTTMEDYSIYQSKGFSVNYS